MFNNVAVVKKANVYFDGKVTSRTVIFENGEKKTLGFMQAGEYKFNTGDKEIMEILAGSIDVKIAGAEQFTTYQEGTSFEVPANSSFEITVPNFVDYCCSYIKE
ncbi:MAG TPA: hypothetical protein DCP97_05535 [Ruminococcaceae bacterium]|nr:hypothetical protein [Oscillospiraceae bacterium]